MEDGERLYRMGDERVGRYDECDDESDYSRYDSDDLMNQHAMYDSAAYWNERDNRKHRHVEKIYNQIFRRRFRTSPDTTSSSSDSEGDDSSTDDDEFGPINCGVTLPTRRDFHEAMYGIRCENLGPTAEEIKTKMNIKIPLRYIHNGMVLTKSEMDEAMETMRCDARDPSSSGARDVRGEMRVQPDHSTRANAPNPYSNATPHRSLFYSRTESYSDDDDVEEERSARWYPGSKAPQSESHQSHSSQSQPQSKSRQRLHSQSSHSHSQSHSHSESQSKSQSQSYSQSQATQQSEQQEQQQTRTAEVDYYYYDDEEDDRREILPLTSFIPFDEPSEPDRRDVSTATSSSHGRGRAHANAAVAPESFEPTAAATPVPSMDLSSLPHEKPMVPVPADFESNSAAKNLRHNQHTPQSGPVHGSNAFMTNASPLDGLDDSAQQSPSFDERDAFFNKNSRKSEGKLRNLKKECFNEPVHSRPKGVPLAVAYAQQAAEARKGHTGAETIVLDGPSSRFEDLPQEPGAVVLGGNDNHRVMDKADMGRRQEHKQPADQPTKLSQKIKDTTEEVGIPTKDHMPMNSDQKKEDQTLDKLMGPVGAACPRDQPSPKTVPAYINCVPDDVESTLGGDTFAGHTSGDWRANNPPNSGEIGHAVTASNALMRQSEADKTPTQDATPFHNAKAQCQPGQDQIRVQAGGPKSSMSNLKQSRHPNVDGLADNHARLAQQIDTNELLDAARSHPVETPTHPSAIPARGMPLNESETGKEGNDYIGIVMNYIDSVLEKKPSDIPEGLKSDFSAPNSDGQSGGNIITPHFARQTPRKTHDIDVAAAHYIQAHNELGARRKQTQDTQVVPEMTTTLRPSTLEQIDAGGMKNSSERHQTVLEKEQDQINNQQSKYVPRHTGNERHQFGLATDHEPCTNEVIQRLETEAQNHHEALLGSETDNFHLVYDNENSSQELVATEKSMLQKLSKLEEDDEGYDMSLDASLALKLSQPVVWWELYGVVWEMTKQTLLTEAAKYASAMLQVVQELAEQEDENFDNDLSAKILGVPSDIPELFVPSHDSCPSFQSEEESMDITDEYVSRANEDSVLDINISHLYTKDETTAIDEVMVTRPAFVPEAIECIHDDEGTVPDLDDQSHMSLEGYSSIDDMIRSLTQERAYAEANRVLDREEIDKSMPPLIDEEANFNDSFASSAPANSGQLESRPQNWLVVGLAKLLVHVITWTGLRWWRQRR